MITTKPKVGSLVGLKVIAILLLFWWHSPMPKPYVDLGARTCEFLFVTSGFLIGYNYCDRNVPSTWEESLRFSLGKLTKFWPLHLIATIIFLLTKGGIYTLWDVLRLIINLLLLQTWSPYASEYFGFNGLSWFLADLIFCYFCTPFLLKFIRHIKSASILFCGAFLVRGIIEYAVVECSGYFWDISIHTNPVVRCIEFAMGLSLYSIFSFLKLKVIGWSNQKRKICCSFFEAAAIILLLFAVIKRQEVWYKFEYVFCFCLFLLVFAINEGLFSKLLSTKPFQWFNQIQFEFYILQIVFVYALQDLIANRIISSIVIFVVVVVISKLYHEYASKKSEAVMRHLYNQFFNQLKFDIRL